MSDQVRDPRQVAPPRDAVPAPSYDPLKLCVAATVALIAWVLGPIAVLGFALVGAAGYVRARRAGLLHSRCKLGDTRVVIAYLVLVAVAGAAGTAYAVTGGHLGV